MSITPNAAFLELYGSETYADLVLVCAERMFQLHRLVICKQLEWFDKKCRGAIEEQVVLLEDNPDAVELMIEYLYKADYKVASKDESAFTHAQLFELACRYEIEALKELAAEKFRAYLRKNGETDSNVEKCIRHVYQSASSADCQFLEQLFIDPDVTPPNEMAGLQDFLSENHTFAISFSKLLSKYLCYNTCEGGKRYFNLMKSTAQRVSPRCLRCEQICKLEITLRDPTLDTMRVRATCRNRTCVNMRFNGAWVYLKEFPDAVLEKVEEEDESESEEELYKEATARMSPIKEPVVQTWPGTPVGQRRRILRFL